MNISTRLVLLGSVAAASLALPSVAFAQASGEEEASAASPADAVEGEGNEIVVTATKREQTLQDVPVAVSVTTADQIERAQIRDVRDLQSLVPSLKVTQSQAQFATTYNIRGFGTSGNNVGLEPSVGVFIDGVYRSRAISQVSDMPDIQRVEVLRGPQSTLFGKNSSAGVISFVTKKPKFDFGGSIEASYGNYNAIVGKAYITGPIAETVAVSLAAGINKRDGFTQDLALAQRTDNRDRWFLRGQMLFEPSSDVSVRIIADVDQIDENCCSVFSVRSSNATLAIQSLGGRVNALPTLFDNLVYNTIPASNNIRNWGLSGQIDYGMGPFKLTSITSYRENRTRASQDTDFTSLDIAQGANIGRVDLKTFTQEVRLASDLPGPVNFLLGAYYFNEDVDSGDSIKWGKDARNYFNVLVQSLSSGALSIPLFETLSGAPAGGYFTQGQGLTGNYKVKNQAYSLFGNVDFEVADRLTITLGGSYTHDAKDVTTSTSSTDTFSAVDLVTVGSGIVRNQVIATQVGAALGLTPAGTLATASQIGAFAVSNNATYNSIVTGAASYASANATNPAVNQFLALRTLQLLPPFLNIPNAVESGKTRDGDWSMTARLAYEFSDSLNAYAAYSTGFKASSFNLSRDSRPTATDLTAIRTAGLALTNLTSGTRFARPEDATLYEVGIKGSWGTGSANLTVFKQSIKNFQANLFTGTGYILSNAEKRSTFGVEFDSRFNPVENLTLAFAVTYLEPKYDKFTQSPFGDVSGSRITTIPEWSGVIGIDWKQPVSDSSKVILHADYNFSSSIWAEEGLPGYITRNALGVVTNYATGIAAASAFQYKVSNLSASISWAMDSGLELSLWGRNLLNDRDITGIFDSVAQSGAISGYLNQPRTWGGSMRFKF